VSVLGTWFGVVCVGLNVYDEFMSATSSASAVKNMLIRFKMPATVVKILPILASSVS
jgi:hypothetical protein